MRLRANGHAIADDVERAMLFAYKRAFNNGFYVTAMELANELRDGKLQRETRETAAVFYTAYRGDHQLVEYLNRRLEHENLEYSDAVQPKRAAD